MEQQETEQIRYLTREEVRRAVLEDLRVQTIRNMVSNDIGIEALKRVRSRSKGDEELAVVQKIRNLEAAKLEQEEDLKLIESKINEMENGKKED